MGSLEKLSEAMGVAEEKKDSLQSVMGLVMLEWKDVDDHFKMIQGCLSGCFGELELKEKHLKAVQESAGQSCEEFDSRRMLVEEGLKKLDDNVKSLKGVLQGMESEKMDFERMRDCLEDQLKDVDLKEEHFQGLFREVKLIQSQMEKREYEIDSKEKSLRRREDEVGSKEKKLELRENEVAAKERILERRQNVLDSEEKKLERRLNELDSKEKILVGRENEIGSKEKMLGRRENEIDSKEKMLEIMKTEVDSKERLLERRESLLCSEEERMEKKENELDTKEKNLMNLLKELEVKEGILDLKLKLVSMKSPPDQFIKEPGPVITSKSAEVVRGEGRKRCVNSVLASCGIHDLDEGITVKENSSKLAKRSCFHDKFSPQIKARDLGKTGSGSNDTPQAINTRRILVLDDSESDSDSKGNLASNAVNDSSPFSSSTEKGKPVRHFNVGETWACFDAKDNMPRSYAQVIKVIDDGGKVRLGVAWLKPCPVYNGEKEWIDAGLPVTCGKFERMRTSVEAPSIFSHKIFSAGEDPHKIIPREGETWAIYKDWSIISWASYPEIQRQCKYEIVKIMSYPQGGPSSLGVRVAYLDKIKESLNLFKRRRKNEGDSFVIKPNSLYWFSHKVPSVQKTCKERNGILDCIFELDLKSLPPGLQ